MGVFYHIACSINIICGHKITITIHKGHFITVRELIESGSENKFRKDEELPFQVKYT